MSPAPFDPPSPLSWSGAPGRELARRAWPIAVSTLSYSAMSLVGAAFVARVGAAEVAGVGLASVAAFAMLCFAIGALRGAKTLVAQALGAGRTADADRYLGVAILFALGWGVTTTVLAEALAPLLGALASDHAVGHHAATYLRIRALAAPLVLVTVAMRETRWAEGDARMPMRATVAGNLVNLGLDAVLIVGLGWGVPHAHRHPVHRRHRHRDLLDDRPSPGRPLRWVPALTRPSPRS